MSDLDKSILQTLAFFDIFSYPLTETEIWKWLYQPSVKYSLLEVKNALDNSAVLKNELGQMEGFYSIKGKEHTVFMRKQNNNLAERKFFRALRLLRFYRFIPFVRMVAICNTLAYSNAKEDSDIDFFIICRHNKIWLARFFAIIAVKMLASRPKEDSHKDTFCLSFFIDEASLDISSINLSKDVYMPYWTAQLMPIYNPDGLYEKFIKTNSWHHRYLPNAYTNQFSKEIKATWLTRICAAIIGFIVSPPLLNHWTDDIYRHIQIPIIDRNLRSLVNIDSRVVVNESMLKFHDNDRREYFYKKWKEKIYKLLNRYEQNSEQTL